MCTIVKTCILPMVVGASYNPTAEEHDSDYTS